MDIQLLLLKTIFTEHTTSSYVNNSKWCVHIYFIPYVHKQNGFQMKFSGLADPYNYRPINRALEFAFCCWICCHVAVLSVFNLRNNPFIRLTW